MTYFRLTALSLTFSALLTLPAPAVEVQAYVPDPSLRQAQLKLPPPLRIAEALSISPLAALQPASVAAADSLAALDAWNARGMQPTKIGFARGLPRHLSLRISDSNLDEMIGRESGGGFLGRSSEGNWVWGTSVEIPEARALRLLLEDVQLPQGTRFWVYPEQGEARSFGLDLLRADGSLVTPTIRGERIFLEVEIPRVAAAPGQGFVVKSVYESVRVVGGSGAPEALPQAPQADSCLFNAECFDAIDFPGIEVARDAVFQYDFVEGIDQFICTGGLLNDTDAATTIPWMLTANHCIPSQVVAQTMNTFFFYRYSNCAASGADYVDGPVGADLVVTRAAQDVTLVRPSVPEDLPAGVAYLGWNSNPVANGTALFRISHPYRNFPAQIEPQTFSTYQYENPPSISCPGVSTTNFLYSGHSDGTGHSGGSSGSPVMLSNGQVVGQLYASCGLPPQDGCGADETSVDGAFSASFSALQAYLDPPSGSVCVRDADTACLLDGRFKVEVTWQTATTTGTGKVMSFNGERAESRESAFFWFFNATNFEMGVKMVDACVAPFNRYWVFFSGLTSQGYQVKVTRMSDGLVKIYPPNPVGNIPETTADTDAFTCP